MSLQPLVRDYLTSAGFRILEERTDCLVADKLIFGEERDTWLVWTLPPGQEPSDYEYTLHKNILSMRPNYPDAKAYVLVLSRGGFSREFSQILTDLGIKFLVPVWFFDAPFKVEEAPKAASAITDIRSLAASQNRVPQPFSLEDGSAGPEADLFDQLRSELTRPDSACVRVVVGRAGIGKTFLFRALFDSLYDDFLSAKKEQRTRARPIPLLPEHLKGAYAVRTEALLDNFLRTDVAAPVARETFEWLLVNGFATWLLDGLDELYAGDPSFFNYLLDLVTVPDSKAQITIWSRDSLLTTSEEFAEFRDMCAGTTVLKIYRLSEWKRRSQRQFAWLALEKRFPNSGEEDSEKVKEFLSSLDRSPTLNSLCGLPFYCDLLLKQHQEGMLREFPDEVALLDYVINQIVQREIDKGLLDPHLFETDGLNHWLEQIAMDYVESQRSADINRDQAEEYGLLVLRADLDDKTRHHILTTLLQFPLFRAGEKTGLIAFAHDLVAEALAARGYIRLLARRPGVIAERLVRVDLEDPTLLRFMASRLDGAAMEALLKEMRQGNLQGRGFAVALSLLLLARPECDLLKQLGVSLEARDLVAVRFKSRDLSSLSFRGSDLSHAVFTDCNLRGACFEGAFLKRTRFDGKNELQGARFGDLSRVQSVWVGRNFLDDLDRIAAWIAKATEAPVPPGEPCPTARQVVYLFQKYITPLGQPRRDTLGRRPLLGGKRFQEAASPKACLEEAVRQGYLTGPDNHDRFRRAEGDKYAEMVRFVREGSISDGIGRLIAALCRRRGCLHRLHF